MIDLPEVELWTDGSCPQNPGPGGWCAILRMPTCPGCEGRGRIATIAGERTAWPTGSKLNREVRYEDCGRCRGTGSYERELSGCEDATTNNRMELTAVLEGLYALTRPARVVVFTDSQYVQHAFTKHWLKRWKANGWRKGPNSAKQVKNVDLWMALDTACNVHDVCWMWVRGHDGNELNERCDVVAGKQARALIARLAGESYPEVKAA